MKAYLFWYISVQGATTEYIYIIALSYKQAKYFWVNHLKNNIGRPYDYDLEPCHEIDKSQFIRHHEIGDILGQYAVI